jgi:hypothetical protein
MKKEKEKNEFIFPIRNEMEIINSEQGIKVVREEKAKIGGSALFDHSTSEDLQIYIDDVIASEQAA